MADSDPRPVPPDDTATPPHGDPLAPTETPGVPRTEAPAPEDGPGGPGEDEAAPAPRERPHGDALTD